MKWLIGLFAIVSLGFAMPAYWGFTGWLPIDETDFSKAEIEYYGIVPTPIPCLNAETIECIPPVIQSSGGSGSYTDSSKEEEYWKENRPSFSENFPRAFIQKDGCKWFNTIKNECEG